jgi:hypothetical protein
MKLREPNTTVVLASLTVLAHRKRDCVADLEQQRAVIRRAFAVLDRVLARHSEFSVALSDRSG